MRLRLDSANLASLALACLCSNAAASQIDTLVSWDGLSSTGTFGEGSTDTFGQTFTVNGQETVLDSFSFWINDRNNPAPIDFAAYVYEWSDPVGIAEAGHAIGPTLYESAPIVTTNNAGEDGMELFTFNTGGIQLAPGRKYVAFVSSSLFWDGSHGGGEFGTTTVDVYSNGEFVYQATGNYFDPLITQGGWNTSLTDTAFRASFSKLLAIPDPPAATLLLSAVLALLGLRTQMGPWRTPACEQADNQADALLMPV